MIRSLLICSFLASYPAAGAPPAVKLDFRLNPVHALLNFAETATNEPHRAGALKTHIEKTIPKTTAYDQALQQFHEAYRALNSGYVFEGFPFSRHAGMSVRESIQIQSAFARDLSDLASRITGLLPAGQKAQLIGALEDLAPVYQKYIWKPSLKALQARQKRLQKMAVQAQIDVLFGQALTFYRSNWRPQDSFIIALYPIPGERGNSSAQSNFQVESVGVLLESQDDAGLFGVLFHELCHSLFDAQPASLQKEFESWFEPGTHRYGAISYGWINEALATALGNGLAYERITGTLDKNWYANPYVEGFARAIFPEVKRYLAESKSLDPAFVQNARGLFAQNFPKSIFEYKNLFTRIVMLYDGQVFPKAEIHPAMSQVFQMNSRSAYPSLADREGLPDLKQTTDTRIVIIGAQDRQKLSELAALFPSLNSHLDELRQHPAPYVFWKEIRPGQGLLILSAQSASELGGLLQKLALRQSVDPELAFQVLE